MKIIRSSKCSTKFATEKKRMELQAILSEYGKVVNIFIGYFWDKKFDKTQLLKPIVDLPKGSWLSARLRKVAAREALDMIRSVIEVQESNKEMLQEGISTITKIIDRTPLTTKKNRRKVNNLHIGLKAKTNKLAMLHPHKPKHTGDRMSVSCTIADLQVLKDTTEFDAWLHMASIGNQIVLDVPVRYHRHFRGLASRATRLNSYVVTKNYVQFAFERETGPKKDGKNVVGVDTGINALASTSNAIQYGRDIKALIEKSKRCQKGSKGKQRAVNALRQRICEVAKQVVKDADVVVVEKLQGIGKNTKLKGRLSLNMRSSIGSWNYAYWLNRVEMNCEESRASFRTVPSYYTSQACPACGHTDGRNRVGEVFECRSCGFSGNADLVAASNIRDRFLGGPYGAAYKRKEVVKLECPVLSKFT